MIFHADCKALRAEYRSTLPACLSADTATRYLELKRPYEGLVQVIMPGGGVIATFSNGLGSEPAQSAERNAAIFATRWVAAENRPRVSRSRDVVGAGWDWRWITSEMPF